MTAFLPSRRLGQNFLIDPRVLERIVEACCFRNDDHVLEIGPGQGVLTRAILPLVGHVTAVEADARLAESLQRECLDEKLTVYHADILAFDFSSETMRTTQKVVGNIPYNISTPIIEKMLEQRQWVKALFITVQYEFGMRLTAAPGSKEYSALTCLLNYFAEPKILFRISNRAFRPAPKVESCFMRMDFRQDTQPSVKDEDFLIRLVRTVFLQRRKTILNAAASLAPKETLKLSLAEAGINEKARPEDVTVEEYVKLTNIMSP